MRCVTRQGFKLCGNHGISVAEIRRSALNQAIVACGESPVEYRNYADAIE